MITAATITDEQIKELWSANPPSITGVTLMDALGIESGPCMRKPTAEETQSARARCAEILSTRAAVSK